MVSCAFVPVSFYPSYCHLLMQFFTRCKMQFLMQDFHRRLSLKYHFHKAHGHLDHLKNEVHPWHLTLPTYLWTGLRPEPFQDVTLNPSHAWRRLIDDNFMIWTHGEDSLLECITYLNSPPPINSHMNLVPLLDLLISWTSL